MRRNEQDQRLLRQNEILSRIADLISSDSEGTATDLVNAALAMFARCYPATLSPECKSKIKANYASATAALMAERAMSTEGVLMTLAAGQQMGAIAIDYSPLSDCTPELTNDKAFGGYIQTVLRPAITQAFDEAVTIGVSTFGVATTLILIAVEQAKQSGINPIQLARPLLEALDFALDPGPQRSQHDMDESLIDLLCRQMSVSRRTAQRYIKQSRNTPRADNAGGGGGDGK